MRSKKVEAKIKSDINYAAVGPDFTGQDITEYTNEGSDAFCPFIDNKRLGKMICSKHGEGIIHRSYPTSAFYPPGVAWPKKFDVSKCNQKNRHYHWVQLENFQSVQICKFQRDPVTRSNDVCEKHFLKCPVYLEHVKEDPIKRVK
jgi:hypothetical protein